LLFPPDSYRGVRLEGTRSIQKLVLRDQLLDAPPISRVTDFLSRHLPSGAETYEPLNRPKTGGQALGLGLASNSDLRRVHPQT
jgi:hypothetical protein